MEALPPNKGRPEAKIQKAICNRLRQKGWYVRETHGNMYQSGFPDVYATHQKYGQRWIEVKLPNMKGSHFTRAQKDVFPQLVANGTKIWIITGHNDYELDKLFKPQNIMNFFDKLIS